MKINKLTVYWQYSFNYVTYIKNTENSKTFLLQKGLNLQLVKSYHLNKCLKRCLVRRFQKCFCFYLLQSRGTPSKLNSSLRGVSQPAVEF